MVRRYSAERRRGSWAFGPFMHAADGLRWGGLLREVAPEIVLILLSIYLWYVADGFRQVGPNDLGPDFWPKLLLFLLGLTACVRLVQKVRTIRRRQLDPPQHPVPEPASVGEAEEDAEDGNDAPIDKIKAAVVIVLSIAYVLGVIYLGYVLATFLFLVCFMWLAGKRNWLINIPLSAAGALVFAYVFQKLVFVDLPTGTGIFDTFTVWLYHLIGIY